MNRISVSFPQQYEAEYRHIQELKKRTNVSLYICELIRKDMRGNDLEKRLALIEKRIDNLKPAAKPTPERTVEDKDLQAAAAAFEL
jgi:Arc/MetJ-type ribon-helix-helix transcriptional regulator